MEEVRLERELGRMSAEALRDSDVKEEQGHCTAEPAQAALEAGGCSMDWR